MFKSEKRWPFSRYILLSLCFLVIITVCMVTFFDIQSVENHIVSLTEKYVSETEHDILFSLDVLVQQTEILNQEEQKDATKQVVSIIEALNKNDHYIHEMRIFLPSADGLLIDSNDPTAGLIPREAETVVTTGETIRKEENSDGYITTFLPLMLADGKRGVVMIVYDFSVINEISYQILFTHILIGFIITIVGIIIGMLLAMRLAVPIKRIANDVKKISEGNLSHRATSFSYRETLLLQESVNSMAANLEENLHHINSSIEQIEVNLHELAIMNDKIKNPLQAIVGIVDLSCPEISEQVQAYADDIIATINRLDIRWTESANVRQFLKCHYDIE